MTLDNGEILRSLCLSVNCFLLVFGEFRLLQNSLSFCLYNQTPAGQSSWLRVSITRESSVRERERERSMKGERGEKTEGRKGRGKEKREREREM